VTDQQELKDISIIGGGPTGLFAAFYAGMRRASAASSTRFRPWAAS
jgi:thioredoxin reductase